jgi:hypothetical protein
MMQDPLWLTTAGEYDPLAQPRSCTVVGELKSQIDGGTIVVLRIDPPFSDPQLSPPASREELVVISRALGATYSLTKQSVSQVSVHDSPLLIRVGRVVDQSALVTMTYNRQHIQPLPRGALFRTKEGAEELWANIRTANPG